MITRFNLHRVQSRRHLLVVAHVQLARKLQQEEDREPKLEASQKKISEAD